MAGQYGYEDEQRLADEGWEPVDVCGWYPTPHCRALGCIFPWRREETVCHADVTTSLAAQIGAMWDAHELQHLLRE